MKIADKLSVHQSADIPLVEAPENPRHPLLDVDIQSISSPALSRLVEEVRNDEIVGRAYNRTYHRHNR